MIVCYVCIHTTCVPVGSPGAEDCDPQYGCWKWNSSPLQEQPVLFFFFFFSCLKFICKNSIGHRSSANSV